MSTQAGTRQACKRCRIRKVKCDGLPKCCNCHSAGTSCEYSPPKKRGPKPVRWQDNRPRKSVSSTSSPTDSCAGLVSPAIPATNTYLYQANDSPISTNSTLVIPLSAPPESQTHAAVTIHLNLLEALAVAAPSDTPESIVNQCILMYTQYVFGTVPMCHEASLRATVSRFFVSTPGGDDPSENRVWVASSFSAADDDEPDHIRILRSYTVLVALCAAVTYVLLEPLLLNKQLVAPLFLRAAREMLRVYEDYDLEHPDSSSLSTRLFLSSAMQIATGTHGVAFHILNEAGLIAMRMRLYDESSLEGREPIEENLLRNAFWQLYVCDKTASVMKGRPVTIHESFFETGLTLKTHSRSSVSLFQVQNPSSGTGLETRLVEGFHVIRRLWAMAARVIQAMESNFRRSLGGHADTRSCCESIPQLSEAYFEMITLTDTSFSDLASSPGDMSSSPGLSRYTDWHADWHIYDILKRQRASYLISLHCVKVFLLNTAIQSNMAEIMGLSAEPLTLAMRQIELAQDFLNVLESVPFLHLQAEGEHCAEKIRRVGSLLLEIAHTAEINVVKSRASQCAMRLIDMLARLNSKASDVISPMVDVDG